jgi:hypothetical protein
MHWTGTLFCQNLPMRSRPITFVLRETILRIFLIQLFHHSISAYLSGNACHRNNKGTTIAFD